MLISLLEKTALVNPSFLMAVKILTETLNQIQNLIVRSLRLGYFSDIAKVNGVEKKYLDWVSR